MCIWSLTYQQSIFNCYHSDKHFSEFYLQDGGKKSTGIDMEQNYITVTLRVVTLLTLINICIMQHLISNHMVESHCLHNRLSTDLTAQLCYDPHAVPPPRKEITDKFQNFLGSPRQLCAPQLRSSFSVYYPMDGRRLSQLRHHGEGTKLTLHAVYWNYHRWNSNSQTFQ